jgi:GT2 family glycosyltransferase
MKSFEVTVVICTFNRAELLRKAIEALFAQVTDDWLQYEILVVDNASTDSTAEVVEEMALDAPVPLHYVREGRPGVACARNRGISDSQTSWIAFLDDDEIADSRWLVSLAEVARANGALCVGGVVPPLLPESCPFNLLDAYRKLTLQFDWGPKIRRCTGEMFVGTGSLLIHRSAVDTVGLFDEKLPEAGEDTDFYRRLRAAGIEAWFTPKSIAMHLIEPERLHESYLRLARLRSGLSFARRDCHRWSAAGMLALALARCVLTSIVRLPRYAWARLTGNVSAQLLLRCSWWSTEGYLRGCLFLVAPKLFCEDSYLEKLDFHADRKVQESKHDANADSETDNIETDNSETDNSVIGNEALGSVAGMGRTALVHAERGIK